MLRLYYQRFKAGARAKEVNLKMMSSERLQAESEARSTS